MPEFLNFLNQGSAFFANFSFLLLFVAMTAYWVNLAFYGSSQQATPVDIQSPSGLNSIAQKSPNIGNIGNIAMFSANISLFCLLLLRWKESGHFPLSNLYESLMFLSWSCTSINLFLIFYFRNQNTYLHQSGDGQNPWYGFGLKPQTLAPPGRIKVTNLEKLLGSVLAPCALFLNAFATFSLPKEMQQAGPLVPALQSNWLMMHVTVMIISYAALMLGSLLSIAFLILGRVTSRYKKVSTYGNGFMVGGLKSSLDQAQTVNPVKAPNHKQATSVDLQGSVSQAKSPLFSYATAELGQGLNTTEFTNSQASSYQKATPVDGQNSLAASGLKSSGLWLGQSPNHPQKPTLSINPIADNLDYLSYRIIGIGFPFLTIGILSGAVWANEAWGSYWSWDPKETWALLTWFVFAIYLHTRFSKGWEGEKPAMLASFGFLVVWMCYLGVNLLGEGLHSYGFLSA